MALEALLYCLLALQPKQGVLQYWSSLFGTAAKRRVTTKVLFNIPTDPDERGREIIEAPLRL
jgi:hypothetical protein